MIRDDEVNVSDSLFLKTCLDRELILPGELEIGDSIIYMIPDSNLEFYLFDITDKRIKIFDSIITQISLEKFLLDYSASHKEIARLMIFNMGEFK